MDAVARPRPPHALRRRHHRRVRRHGRRTAHGVAQLVAQHSGRSRNSEEEARRPWPSRREGDPSRHPPGGRSRKDRSRSRTRGRATDRLRTPPCLAPRRAAVDLPRRRRDSADRAPEPGGRDGQVERDRERRTHEPPDGRGDERPGLPRRGPPRARRSRQRRDPSTRTLDAYGTSSTGSRRRRSPRSRSRAVVAFDNRVRVIAAAGSGKTSVMVARAAYAIERGFVPADRILMLAFNADAAKELQERVRTRLGVLGLSSEGTPGRARSTRSACR